MITISDSTTLILLSKIDRLDLLHLLFDYITIPLAVYNEIFPIINNKSDKCEIIMPYWINVENIENNKAVSDLKNKYRNISRADAEVIILSKEKQADFVLSDDRELHRISKLILEKTDVLYTSSVFIFAKQEGIINSVKVLLDEIRKKGAWISDEIYNQILIKSGEILK